MLKINVLQIVSGKVEFVEVSAPMIVKEDGADTFAALVNTMLYNAYKNDALAKKYASEKSISDAALKMREYDADTDEHEKAEKRKISAEKALVSATTILESLNGITVDEPVSADEAMTSAARMFSYLYSNVRMLNADTNKAVHGYLKGIQPLYMAVSEYADKYRETPETWDEARKEEFNALKSALTEVGGRLNNAGDSGLAKFTYKPTSGAVNELVSRYNTYTKFAKKSGKFTTARDNVNKFQASVISIIFKLDKTSVTKIDFIED